MPTTELRDAFYSWYAQHLKDRALQFTRAGSKASFNNKHAVDPDTGYWTDPNYSGSKPIRWLVHIDPATSPVKASVPDAHRANRLGHANTAQGDKAGIAIRVIPVIAQGGGKFAVKEDWEMTLLFCFADAVPIGSAAETFDFDAASGQLTYLGKDQPYIFSALLGIVSQNDPYSVAGKTITYRDAFGAVARMIANGTDADVSQKIPVYDLTQQAEFVRLRNDVAAAYAAAPSIPKAAPAAAAASPDEDDDTPQAPSAIDIPENKELLGIDPAVYRQINAALKSGKRHLMLYGPPGTGKTTLARHIAQTLSPDRWTMVTGSADWSSQDIIGGYQPVGGGDVAFQPGVLLRAFGEPLIIDEMNRCDIDKVLGPLFTVLSGQHTTLPYRSDIADPKSPQYVILAAAKAGAAPHEFSPGPAWRLVATINSIDKASLYQMSYALTRRFGWIYIDVPKDLSGFLSGYLQQIGVANTGGESPLAALWSAINEVRPIGPAPFIDMIHAMREIDSAASSFGAASESMRSAALDAMDIALLPMLDGITVQEAEKITAAAIAAYGFDDAQQGQVRSRLRGLAV
jgi:hypothetical protein